MRASSPFVASFFASVPDWGVTSTRISLPWREYRERRSAGILPVGTAASCRRNRGRQDGARLATRKAALRPSGSRLDSEDIDTRANLVSLREPRAFRGKSVGEGAVSAAQCADAD